MKPITPQDEQRFSDWQRGLTLWNKRDQSPAEVAERQRELRDAVHSGSAALAAYLRSELELAEGGAADAPTLPLPLDPSEFRDPPFQLERQIFETWRAVVKARFASQSLFWTRSHVLWIEQGYLGEQLAPALLGALQTGKPMSTDEAATRNLLRRLGGLPHVRGKVSVIQDCPLSRCWWRGQIAASAASASHGELDEETAHRVLHTSNDAWDRLAGDSVKRITAVNHPSVRAAIICQYRNASRETGGLDSHEMQDAVRLLARHGPPLVFDTVDWSELLEMSAAAVAEAREARAREANNRKDAVEPDTEPDDEPPQPSRRSRILDRLRGSAGPDP